MATNDGLRAELDELLKEMAEMEAALPGNSVTRLLARQTLALCERYDAALVAAQSEYARMSRVAQQIADGSGCCNCRNIADEFDAAAAKQQEKGT